MVELDWRERTLRVQSRGGLRSLLLEDVRGVEAHLTDRACRVDLLLPNRDETIMRLGQQGVETARALAVDLARALDVPFRISQQG